MTARLTLYPGYGIVNVPVRVFANGKGVRLCVWLDGKLLDLFLPPEDLCGLMEMYGQAAAQDDSTNECGSPVVVRIAE